jgi:hypothetical protein
VKIVAYRRVSRQKQAQSGLGLEAQEADIQRFAKGREARIVAEYTEVKSGKTDARPQLRAALHHAKATGATLVIAKLDRLGEFPTPSSLGHVSNARPFIELVPVCRCALGPSGIELYELRHCYAAEEPTNADRFASALPQVSQRSGSNLHSNWMCSCKFTAFPRGISSNEISVSQSPTNLHH